MNERLYIDQIISISGDLEGPKIIKENREIVLNHLRSLDSHNSNEMLTLTFMLRTSSAEEFFRWFYSSCNRGKHETYYFR